jgi:hypothetical protein
MKKTILLFLFLVPFFMGYSQRIATIGNQTERIEKACHLIKTYEPIIYESMVAHSTIQAQLHPSGNRFWSTYNTEDDNFWILIGTGSLSERSINRLAGTIFHESLHMLLELQRHRSGGVRRFSDLSETEKKQEEIFVYKRTRELLVRLNTADWEIKEYDTWLSAYY